MTLILISFVMVTVLCIAAILKLEDEKRVEHFARLDARRKHFEQR